MPNTANYSFPTPADTDLVKNGADAIRDLGDAVDTAMNTALGTKKAGMVLLNTTSFSAVASQSINDVFSSTYDNYKIIINMTNTVGEGVLFRYRVSGADNSTSNYFYQFFSVFGTSTSAARSSSQTSYNIASASTGTSMYEMILMSPFASTTKSGFVLGTYNAPTTGIELQNRALGFNATTSFTGFTISTGSGTNTGTISVYGINK